MAFFFTGDVMKFDYNPLFLFVIWLLGAITVLIIIVTKEKSRTGAKLFSTIIEDISENPYHACLGYFLTLIFSWFSVINHLLIEKESEHDQ